jgi:hypothetical protein
MPAMPIFAANFGMSKITRRYFLALESLESFYRQKYRQKVSLGGRSTVPITAENGG